MRNLHIFFLTLLMIICFLFPSPFPLSGSALAANPFPQRIVSCMPSITEMLFAIGLDKRIVGVTLNCNYPPAALRKEKVGREVMNVEKIISLKPDLVVMLKSAQPSEIEKLKKRGLPRQAGGLPVMTIDPQTVHGVMTAIIELGKATGNNQQAEKLVAQMQARLGKVRRAMGRVQDSPARQKIAQRESRVLVIVGVNPLVVVGGNNFIADIIKTAGAKNVAAKLRGPYPQYSFEQLVKDDPDAVIVVKNVVLGEKEIYNDKRLQKLRAVQNKRVLVIDADIISRPGPRVVDAVEIIANFLYAKR